MFRLWNGTRPSSIKVNFYFKLQKISIPKTEIDITSSTVDEIDKIIILLRRNSVLFDRLCDISFNVETITLLTTIHLKLPGQFVSKLIKNYGFRGSL